MRTTGSVCSDIFNNFIKSFAVDIYKNHLGDAILIYSRNV